MAVESLEPRNLLAVTTAVQSGDWDDAATWSNGVPDATDRAIIPTGQTVTLAGIDHVAQEIVVAGGVLTVEESGGAAKTLTTRWIHVNSGGVFQIGTELDRYDQNDFVLTLTGTDANADFTVETATGSMSITNNDGFLMPAGGGRLQFFGEDKLTFTKLAATVEAGANQILVESAIDRDFDGDLDADDGSVNWEVGDQIVIASTSDDYRDEEVRNITAIADQGNGTLLITLDTALNERHYGEIERYTRDGVRGDFNSDGVVNAADYTVWRDHLGASTDNAIAGAGDGVAGVTADDYLVWRENFGAEAGPDFRTWEVDMRAEVALLSRNVRIQGLASQDTDNSFGDRALFNSGSTGDHRGISGHIMIMPTAGQNSVEGVQLDRLGQTGTRGRYPIHWHLAGDRSADVLRDVSVTNSNNRGVTVHGTHNLTIEGVVLHDIHGHGFFVEDAVETGNQFLANIAFGIHAVGMANNNIDLSDPFIVDTHDHVGQNATRFLSSAAYWVTNPDNDFIGNISAGSEGTGFWFIFPDSPIGAAASDPQYNGVQPDRVNLGRFEFNSSHSSPIGLNFDRGSDLEVDIGATLKPNFDGDAYRPSVEPLVYHYTGYKHTTGIYHRARTGNFQEIRLADNFAGTFITFTQRITDTLYVGHSRGNADLSQRVTGHTFYDGANTHDGTHFAGFTEPNAHTIRTQNVAIRHTHFVMRNTSFEDDGSADNFRYANQSGVVSSNYDIVGSNMPSIIYDEDGSLTSHVGGGPGTTVVPDHPFFYDAGDTVPTAAGWNTRLSDDLYAVLRFRSPSGQSPLIRVTTPEGDQGQDTTGSGQFAGTNALVKKDAGDYVVDLPNGNNSASNGFDVLYFNVNGPKTGATVVKFTDMGAAFSVDNRPFLNSLTAVRNATQTSWTRVGDDLYVKFFSVNSETDRVEFVPGATDPPPTDGLVLSAIDDAYIENGTTLDNGLLRVESSPSRTRTSYLKFDVPDTPGEVITGATLQLTVSGDPGDNLRIQVYEGGSDNWTEQTLTPATAPAMSSLLDEVTGNFVIGQIYSFDVSSAVTAGEEVSFVIVSDGATSSGDVAFASSENANTSVHPQLVIELGAEVGTTVTLWDDPAPPNNSNNGTAVTAIADPFGTGMGTIGRWVTAGQNRFHNINPSAQDVSAYEGLTYTFSFDYYVDSTQLVLGDTFYQSVYGTGTNFRTIGSSAVQDAWTTLTTTGTIRFDTNQGATLNPLIIVNHQDTPSTTPTLYIDNILFTIEVPPGAGQLLIPAESFLAGQEDATEETTQPLSAAVAFDPAAADAAALALLLDDRSLQGQPTASDEAFSLLGKEAAAEPDDDEALDSLASALA